MPRRIERQRWPSGEGTRREGGRWRQPRGGATLPVMLNAALIVLGIATLLGLGLAALYALVPPARVPWLAGAAHGALGLAGTGLALLVMARPGSEHARVAGAGGFAVQAAVLLAAALAAGGFVLAARLRRRTPSVVVLAIHATLGVAGFIMLASYASVAGR